MACLDHEEYIEGRHIIPLRLNHQLRLFCSGGLENVMRMEGDQSDINLGEIKFNDSILLIIRITYTPRGHHEVDTAMDTAGLSYMWVIYRGT